MKKHLIILLAVFLIAMVFAHSVVAYGKANIKSKQCNVAITAYWNAVDSQAWDEWEQAIAPCARANAHELLMYQENFENNIGILTVSKANISSIAEMDDSHIPWNIYSEISDYSASKSLHACYCVEVELTVREENHFFTNGINRFIMTLVYDETNWFVAEMSAMTDDEQLTENQTTGTRYVFDTPAPGSLVGFASVPSCKTEPSTISVKDELYAIHKNVPFDTYLLNVVYHEIGASFPTQALYANIIQLKTLSWIFCRKQPYAAYGYDISFGWVAYTSTLSASTSEQNTINQAIAQMKSNYMITGSSVGNKLFFADHYGDPIPANGGFASGVLYQNQSKKLALGQVDGHNYTWKEILHYFYDNSSHNSSVSIGVVRFRTEDAHSPSTNYSYNSLRHWKKCTSCSTVLSNTYNIHHWVTSGTQEYCSICGYNNLNQ